MKKISFLAGLGVLGALFAAIPVGMWVNNVMESSLMDGGTMYRPQFPAISPEKPKESFLCPAKLENRWTGCIL